METDPAPGLRVVDQDPSEAAPTPPPASKSPSKRPTKPLPTPRIAFGKQLDVLRGWAVASGAEGKAVTNKQVGDIVKLSPDTVTLANAFFADVGFLQRTDGGYVPTAPTVAFNQAYAWNPENAAQKLEPPLRNAWFGKALLPHLSYNPISEDEAVQVLAEEADAAPTYKPQLLLILDYLEVAGIVVRDSGQVRLGAVASESPGGREPSPSAEPKVHVAAREPKATSVATAFTQSPEGQIQFNVSFRVSMAEFADWQADRITAFFNGIAQVLAAKADVEKGAAK